MKDTKGIRLKDVFIRSLYFCLAMLLLSVLAFVLARIAPGDPLQAFYGDALEGMTETEREMARQRLGLDDGIAVQYLHWAQNALRGDLGLSFQYKMPVLQVVAPLVGNTLLLGASAYVLVFGIAILLAAACVLHEDGPLDRFICKAGTVLYYVPGFWLGVLLVLLFSVRLHWLPSSGAYDVGMEGSLWNRARHMVLPLTVMATSHLWYYGYMIRNKLLDEARKDYVLLARAKGCSSREIVWKHCLRNAAPTIISIMAVSVPHITGGTVIVESVFHYPGIGNLAIESAKYHDYNLLMVLVLLTGAMVLLSGSIAKLLNEALDPRMKPAGSIRW